MAQPSVQLPHVPRSVIEADRIGAEICFADYARSLKSSAAMLEHDRRYCRVLDASGRQGFEHRDLHRICMITGAAQKLETFKRRQILQTVMASEHREMTTELEAFFSKAKKKGQMLVVSAGHVGLDDYRDRHESFGRAVSRLAQKLKRRFGQCIQFSNIENAYHRRQSGDLMMHMHSHILLTGKYLPSDTYEEMKDYAKSFMKKQGFREYCHLSKLRLSNKDGKDGNRGTVSEAIKYAFSPDKGEKNVQLRDDEIVKLADATFGLKFYKPKGDFLKFRKTLQGRTWVECELDVSPVTGEVRLDPFGNPVRIWKTVREPGRKIVRRKDEKTKKINFVTVDRDTREAAHQVRNDSGADTDIVLGGQLPAPWAGTRMTPSFIVQRFEGDFAALVRKRRLAGRVDEVRRIWNARVRADGRADLEVPLIGVPAAQRPCHPRSGHYTTNCALSAPTGPPLAVLGPPPAPP